jgi:hypothetical protein
MTTLADQFLKARGRKGLNPIVGRQFAWTAGQIEKAQRFVFDASTIEAVRGLLRSKPSTLLEATAFARLPYPLCWFEWPAPPDGPIDENQVRVAKVGAVLQQLDGRANAYSITTAWAFDKASVGAAVMDMDLERIVEESLSDLGVSALVGGVDFSPEPLTLGPPWWQGHKPGGREIEDKLMRRYGAVDPTQAQAVRILNEMIGYQPNGAEGVEMLKIAASMGDDYVKSKIRDIADDILPLLGMMILLNSKNGVDTRAHEPPPKLNKARAKRGQPPLIAYREVTIKLGGGDRRAVRAGGVSHEEVSRHLVRGHFKVRKSGVYWWRNHIRGSETKGDVRHTLYKVTGGDDAQERRGDPVAR